MKTTIETITPNKAAQLLEKHWVKENQRKFSPSTAASYARAMKAGQWGLTHQGIAISDEGELIDGIHRLSAVVDSGVSIQCMVTTGIPGGCNGGGAKVIDVIDAGRPRGVGQQLQLRHGVYNGNMYAAITRTLMHLCAQTEKMHVGKFSVANSLVVADIYEKEITHCFEHRSPDKIVRNAPVMAAAAFAMKAFPTQIEDFYARLTLGENLRREDPAHTCRRWLQTYPGRGTNLIQPRAVLTAAMKHVNGETLQRIYDTESGYRFFASKQKRAINRVLRGTGYIDV